MTPRRIAGALGSVVLATVILPAAGAAAEALGHSLVRGEHFSYARTITYRDSGGVQHEDADIILEVESASPAAASIRQRIHVHGRPGTGKIRGIVASPDGTWMYPDHNSVAQDFVTWDASQLGKQPGEIKAGQTWEVDVPKSAMFTAGHAVVRVVAISGKNVTIEADGDTGQQDRNVLDRDTHKYVPISTRGRWKTVVSYADGIVQQFHRLDKTHVNVNHGSAQTDDEVDVTIRLVDRTS